MKRIRIQKYVMNHYNTINNTNSFLNEMEFWKRLNKIKARRGKYLTACPEIENLQTFQTYFSHSAPLLISHLLK